MELVFGSFIPRPPHEAGIAGRKWQGDDIEAVAAVLAVITTVGERIAAIPEAPKRISITSDNICHIKSVVYTLQREHVLVFTHAKYENTFYPTLQN
jgi:hypothetical protein